MSGSGFQPLLFDRQLREPWFLRDRLRVHAEGGLANESVNGSVTLGFTETEQSQMFQLPT